MPEHDGSDQLRSRSLAMAATDHATAPFDSLLLVSDAKTGGLWPRRASKTSGRRKLLLSLTTNLFHQDECKPCPRSDV
jgi:hypothetical protein